MKKMKNLLFMLLAAFTVNVSADAIVTYLLKWAISQLRLMPS